MILGLYELSRGGFPSRFVQVAEIDKREFDPLRLQHFLARLITNSHKPCSQRFVPPYNFSEGSFECGNVQLTFQRYCFRVVVSRASLQLLQKPQTLLCERQRQQTVPRL